MSQPLVSIIILNWNGHEIIKECLDSIRKLNYPNFETIVIDNGSTDGSQKYLESFNEIILIKNNKNLGYAGGNNVGFKIAKGKYVAVINNDVIVDPSWLQLIVNYLEQDENIAAAGGCLKRFYESSKLDCLFCYIGYDLMMRECTNKKIYEKIKAINKPVKVISLSGAAIVLRKNILDKLNGFDETLFSYHEEADLCMRIFLAGYKCIFVPDAIAFHKRSLSFSKIKETAFYYQTRNRFLFIYKYSPLSLFILRIPLLILREIRIIRVAIFKTKLFNYYLKAVTDALKLFPAISQQRKINMRNLKLKKNLYKKLLKKKYLIINE